MVKHYNTSISEDASRIFNNKGDFISSEISPIIQPTVLVTRVCDIVRSASASNAAIATIYTTPTDKDFYLIGVSLHVIKDVTATSVVSAIKVTVDKDPTLREMIRIGGIAFTPQDQSLSLSLPLPIKIARGSIIYVTNSTTTANVLSYGSIVGYTVECTK